MKKTYTKPEITIVKLQMQSHLMQTSSVTSVGGNADFDPVITGSYSDARTREFEAWEEW